jgi:uncharacterized membrane protein YdfJ with MMPL/SSD domain
MRISNALAALLLSAALVTPATSNAAVDWGEWGRLIRKRPVAVVVAIIPLALTSPFMLASWAIPDGEGEKDDD